MGFGRLGERRVVVSVGAGLLDAHGGVVSGVAASSSGAVGVALGAASDGSGLWELRRVVG